MSKFELSLSSDYVPGWTIVDAIRELFQNAVDQEAQCPDNTASWDYSDDTLRVSNKKSTLTTTSLLLGSTSKAGDTGTIGQFGEGYKVATLVLLREGKTVTFYNYGAREVWRPRFVKSRRFNADILTFFIDKEFPWTNVPSDDLVVEIQGITDDEWLESIVPSNLRLRDDFDVVETTDFGDIISLPGQVFVNGLFVCNYKPYKYGYNFKPGQLKLDRDRKLASDFDLKWLASKMWSQTAYDSKVLDLLSQGAPDVQFVADIGYRHTLSNRAYEMFSDKYGPNAVSVTYQSDADNLPKTYKAIIVPETFRRLIVSSSGYIAPVYDEQTIQERLQEWYDIYKYLLTDEAKSNLEIIIEDSAN